jgi:hypothetical protein
LGSPIFLPVMTWDHNPSTCISHIGGTTGMYHPAWLVGWDGGLTFYLGGPRTGILPILASQVAGLQLWITTLAWVFLIQVW